MNAKQLLQSIVLLVQLAPSELWGDAMYESGIFPHLLKTLLAEEVSPHDFRSIEHGLTVNNRPIL
jgi:hypothetical protein